MTAPSKRDYLVASEAVYGESQPGFVEASLADSIIHNPSKSDLMDDERIFLNEEGVYDWKVIDIAYKPDEGLYGAAFLTNENQLLVAFEGTVFNKSNYGFHSLEDDISVYRSNSLHGLFNDDVQFAKDALASAKLQLPGITSEDEFVTGHSLGGVEAEYVGMLMGTGGSTFGAPGLPHYRDGGTHDNLIDYVDYGDPVGNFASNEPEDLPRESDAADLLTQDHVGLIRPVGIKSTKNDLLSADDNGLPNKIISADKIVSSYHAISRYARDLGEFGLRSLDNNLNYITFAEQTIIANIDADFGNLGRSDISTFKPQKGGVAESNDYVVKLRPRAGTLTIQQTRDTYSPDKINGRAMQRTSASSNRIYDAGLYNITLTPDDRHVINSSFLDSDNGDITQFIPDDNKLSRTTDISLSAASDTLIIRSAASYAGRILGLSQGAVLDLLGTDMVTGVHLASDDRLVVSDGSAVVASLQLAADGNYAGDIFEAAADGYGGTKIVVNNVAVFLGKSEFGERDGNGEFILNRSGDLSQAATVYVSTTDGTEVPGEDINAGDYKSLSYQPVTFQPGSATANVNFTINDLGLTDGAVKNFGFQVAADQSGADIVTAGSFAIVDDDSTLTPPTNQSISYAGDVSGNSPGSSSPTQTNPINVTISPFAPAINENSGSAQFTLSRTGDIARASTVYVSSTDGSTVAGESVNDGDFGPLTYQAVTFAAGSSTATTSLAINDLGLYDGSSKSYGLEVTSDPSDANVLATDPFSILDNDPAPPSTVSISPSNPSFDEAAGTGQFTITRGGDSSLPLTVYVTTTDGSTVPGESVNANDFSPLALQPVTFTAGSDTAQIGLTINDLGLTNGSAKNFGVQVTGNYYGLNVLATDQFSIVDNDPPPPLSISPVNPSVDAREGSEQFTLTRSGDLSQPHTVYVSTIDGSSASGAAAGYSLNIGVIDTLQNEPVTFGAGEAHASFDVGLNEGVGKFGLAVSDSPENDPAPADTFTVTEQEATYSYVGEAFGSKPSGSGLPFSPSSLDMSVTFKDVPNNYTGQIGSIGTTEGGFDLESWSIQGEGGSISSNQTPDISSYDLVFKFVNGEISSWGVHVDGIGPQGNGFNFRSGDFDPFTGSTADSGDQATYNGHTGATSMLGSWTRSA